MPNKGGRLKLFGSYLCQALLQRKILNFLRKTSTAAKISSKILAYLCFWVSFLHVLPALGEMWTSPTYKVGESNSPGGGKRSVGGMFVQASAFPLALLLQYCCTRGASPEEALLLAPLGSAHKMRDPVLRQCLLIRHPLGVALAGSCAVQRRLAGCSTVVVQS